MDAARQTAGTRRMTTGAGALMRTLLGGAVLALAWTPAALAGPRAACELLTVPQVGAALGAPVQVDASASGPDPNGGDNCVWVTKDGRNVMTRVVRVANPQFVDYTFKSETSNAYSVGKPPETVSGVGNEARYRAYEGTLQGGVVVARKGSVIYVVEGRLARGPLIELAKSLAAGL